MLPKSWARLGKAAVDFKKYMEFMLDEEVSLIKRGERGTGSLMTSLVRASDLQGDEDAASTSVKEHASSKGLSMEEIFGNIFVINFAGHDTTANTLAFSMLLLATHPEVQAWIAEELRGVLGEGDSETRRLELQPLPAA